MRFKKKKKNLRMFQFYYWILAELYVLYFINAYNELF